MLGLVGQKSLVVKAESGDIADIAKLLRSAGFSVSVSGPEEKEIAVRKEPEEKEPPAEDRLSVFPFVKTTLQHMPVPILVSQGEFEQVVFVNDKFVRDIGYTIEEMPDVHHWWPLAYPDPDYRDQIRRIWTAELAAAREQQQEVAPIEARITTKNGAVRDTLVHAFSVADINIVVFVDVSDILDAQRELKKTLADKDILMREMNHRIKNNLLLVRSLIELQSDTDTAANLTGIRNQIDAIRLVHQQLQHAPGLTRISVGQYLDDVVKSMVNSFGDGNLSVINTLPEVALPTKTSVSLGLIVTEIVTNALKHGFGGMETGEIRLEAGPGSTDSVMELVVSNNGAPIPSSVSVDKPETLGMQIVAALTQQIGGTITLQQVPHPVFTIAVPIPG